MSDTNYGYPLILRTTFKPGPNDWANVTEEDFADDFDYSVQNEGSIFIINPISRAALHWLYRHLDEDTPRWGVLGFVVEHRFIEEIVGQMGRANLVAEHEYDARMAQEEQDRHAGENQ